MRATKVSGQPNVPLKTAPESFAFDGVLKGVLRRRDPDAAPGQLMLEIGHRLAIRPDDEPDQIRNRPHRARRNAHALDATVTRSAVQFGLGR